MILESGLFDAAYYQDELGVPLPAGSDPVEHYLTTGFRHGANPHPLVEGDWYRRQRNLDEKTNPLVEYLTTGRHEGASTHPLFPVDTYTQAVPASRAHPFGPVCHYLTEGHREFPLPGSLMNNGEPADAGSSLIELARHIGTITRETRRHDHFQRQFVRFDYALSRDWKTATRAAFAAADDLPLVSVVIPTWNRARPLRRAIKSVLRQTYGNFELLVVDDGSTDGTDRKINDLLTDDRVQYLRREVSGGVSAARNTALRQAKGDYIAYLDSDNTWKSDFLELMVAHAVTTGARVSYCASQLKGDTTDRVAYRGQPFNSSALRFGNYIDCICVLHERTLLDEVGMFDEDLGRLVDWDLLLRMSSVTEFSYAPFIGTSYDVWADDPTRITRRVSVTTEYVIKAKYELERFATEEMVPGRTSIIIPAYNHGVLTTACVESVLLRPHRDIEVVIVDNGSRVDSAAHFAALAAKYEAVRHIRLDFNTMFAAACNIGAKVATGEFVVFLNNDTLVQPGWLEPLLRPIQAGSAIATQPLLLYPDGTVQCAGTELNRFGMPFHLHAGLPGDAPEVKSGSRTALTGACLAISRADFRSADGFDTRFVNGFEDVDFCLRLKERAGDSVLYFVAESIVVHLESKTQGRGRYTQHNRRRFEQLWNGRAIGSGEEVLAGAGLVVDGYFEPSNGRHAHPVHSPIVTRPRPRQRRWALKIGPKDVMSRESWGDWHFAEALKAELERLGQQVVIDCRDAWYRDTRNLDDVTLTLRGVLPFKPDPGTVNILWLISHPRDVRRDELRRFDKLFVASPSFAASLRQRGLAAETLLQATDPKRFAWEDSQVLNPEHEVLFVGNSRRVMRPIVQQAVTEGLPLRIYGRNWEELAPASAIGEQYIPNDQLPDFYRSAGCVLNDHWADMRRYGFISNRLFDLVACGATVVTDPVEGIDELFGGVVTQLWEDESVRAAIERAVKVPVANREAAARNVALNHSFANRAKVLLEAVEIAEARLPNLAGSRSTGSAATA